MRRLGFAGRLRAFGPVKSLSVSDKPARGAMPKMHALNLSGLPGKCFRKRNYYASKSTSGAT